MYIAPGQGQTAPRGQNFDVNRKALSLYLFVASFKEILLSLILYNFFNDFYVYIGMGQGDIQPPGDKVNRNFLSLWSSVARFKS